MAAALAAKVAPSAIAHQFACGLAALRPINHAGQGAPDAQVKLQQR
jgi:hypothetical protein